MEDLNKNQLILLALLVSFVTSIATGIATVSLLDQAPAEVTRVINRVVERTVETVTPQQDPVQEQVIEETVVIQEEELITETIAKNQKRTVRLYDRSGQFIGRGIIVTDNGQLITTAEVARTDELQVRLDDGTTFEGRGVSRSVQNALGIVEITGDELPTFTPVTYPAAETLKLGQTVVALSGTENTRISLGAISQLSVTEGDEEDSPDGEAEDGVRDVQIGTTIDHATLGPGSVIVNLSGHVLALVGLGDEEEDGPVLVPFTDIMNFSETNI